MTRSAVLTNLAAFCFTCATAGAHEFWIEPATFRPKAGSVLKLGLRVGEPFRGEPVASDPRRIERFFARGASGEVPVTGLDGGDPAGLTRLTQSGAFVIVYQSTPQPHELDAARFTAYLKEEGLDRIIEERVRRGEAERPGRETFTRCAKALVSVDGDGSTSAGGRVWERPAGLPLEIVPVGGLSGRIGTAYPAGSKNRAEDADQPNRALTVQVLYRGQPLAGARLRATDRENAENPLWATTGTDGRATFKDIREGTWMITTIHMDRAGADTKADWESYWASLTMELPQNTAGNQQ